MSKITYIWELKNKTKIIILRFNEHVHGFSYLIGYSDLQKYKLFWYFWKQKINSQMKEFWDSVNNFTFFYIRLVILILKNKTIFLKTNQKKAQFNNFEIQWASSCFSKLSDWLIFVLENILNNLKIITK